MNEANQAGAPIGAGIGAYWEECDAEQKLERLRDAIAQLGMTMNAISSVVERMGAHSHGEKGELLVPIKYMDPYANRASSLSGGLYAHDNGIPYNLRTKHERR